MPSTREGLPQKEVVDNKTEATKETLSALSVGELEAMEAQLRGEWQGADTQEGQAFAQLKEKYASLAEAETSGEMEKKLTPEQKSALEEVAGTPNLAERKQRISAVETSGIPLIDGMMKKIKQVVNSPEYNAAIQAQQRKETISSRTIVVREARQIAAIREKVKTL